MMTGQKHYHRNGISGCGFFCWIDNGYIFVDFTWSGADEKDRHNVQKFSLSDFQAMFSGKKGPWCREAWSGISVRIRGVQKNEGIYYVAFDQREGREVQQMIAIYDPCEVDTACAVFSLEETLKGNLEFANGNSWRGDNYQWALKQAGAFA